MPSVSRAQQDAMHAAAAGKSTIGIPEKVGKEFAAADHARGPTKLPEKVKKGRRKVAEAMASSGGGSGGSYGAGGSSAGAGGGT